MTPKELSKKIDQITADIEDLSSGAYNYDINNLGQEDQNRYYELSGELFELQNQLRDKEEDSKMYQMYGPGDQIAEFEGFVSNLKNTKFYQRSHLDTFDMLKGDPGSYKGAWFNTHIDAGIDRPFPKMRVWYDSTDPKKKSEAVLSFKQDMPSSIVYMGPKQGKLFFRDVKGRKIYVGKRDFPKGQLSVFSPPSR